MAIKPPLIIMDYQQYMICLGKSFCSILDKRIRSSIKLDDAQNGFRKNRRGTDDVLILNNLIRQQGKKPGAYIIVVNSSKAFDRCHILVATLLDKLFKKGINGKLGKHSKLQEVLRKVVHSVHFSSTYT